MEPSEEGPKLLIYAVEMSCKDITMNNYFPVLGQIMTIIVIDEKHYTFYHNLNRNHNHTFFGV